MESRYLDASEKNSDGCRAATAQHTHSVWNGGSKQRTRRLVTFRGGAGTVWGDLTHAAAMAAQCHQARDDGRLAVADAAHHHGALTLATLRGLQHVLQLLEQPVAAHKHRVCGDAGHLEEQRLQHNVHRFVGSKTSWRKRKKGRSELGFSTEWRCYIRTIITTCYANTTSPKVGFPLSLNKPHLPTSAFPPDKRKSFLAGQTIYWCVV